MSSSDRVTVAPTLHRPRTWAEALETKSQLPEAVPVLGGTDVLVDLNFRRLRPEHLLDLSAIAEIRGIERSDETVRIGAGVTFAQLLGFGEPGLRSLATASRTVGSVQIRNRATIAGNLGTGSPAGDAHPPLLALGAEVELACEEGTRLVPIDEFFVAPRRTAMAPSELIAATHVRLVDGGQEFAKVGQRNAMIIAACSFAVAVDPARRRVGTGIGSAGPTPLRAPQAEAFVAGLLDEQDGWEAPRLDRAALNRFGELVASAATPIDDVRATADYRRHALRVLGRRTLSWACGQAATPSGA
jgi:CO/xanthine dehydrogenase FAD-binding subunit